MPLYAFGALPPRPCRGRDPVLQDEPDPAVSSSALFERYLAHRFLPWCRVGGRLTIATSDAGARNRCWLRAVFRGAEIVIVDAGFLDRAISGRFPDRLTDRAVRLLRERKPEFSARRRITFRQGGFVAAFALLLFVLFGLAPGRAMLGLVILSSIGFCLGAGMRVALAMLNERAVAANPVAGDPGLPVYTVLVPLYREAAELPPLAAALNGLDYPKDRLDVKFVVEADDGATRRTAERIAARFGFDVVVVPPSLPRTKPKACNAALPFARGEYLVIYDAEDRPEPDQLRRALAAFRGVPSDTACLQARLAIDNAADGWLAAMFALDYDVWFRVLLPALERLRLPLPLGGTSNHFRIDALRRVLGWDPFNVTEDADLGIRLARYGYRVAVLDSTTYEEAPARLGPWLRQRTRWFKGYMQTLLVHSRRPAETVRHLGLGGALGIFGFLGGAVWSALCNPLLWLVFSVSIFDAHAGGNANAANRFAVISGMGLFGANVMLAGQAMVADRPKEKPRLFFYGAGFVVYWLLISVAAWRAVWQLLFRPFYWEKTPHRGRGGA